MTFESTTELLAKRMLRYYTSLSEVWHSASQLPLKGPLCLQRKCGRLYQSVLLLAVKCNDCRQNVLASLAQTSARTSIHVSSHAFIC